ncbi:MAG: hypothetical protein HY698_06165 [Deltaproteobacteria bacterium]|nr:hypothetical protein [Deltaproteobacteria bacterium]
MRRGITWFFIPAACLAITYFAMRSFSRFEHSAMGSLQVGSDEQRPPIGVELASTHTQVARFSGALPPRSDDSRLSLVEGPRQETESEIEYKVRVRLVNTVQRFVEQARLDPVQEQAIFRLLADAQENAARSWQEDTNWYNEILTQYGMRAENSSKREAAYLDSRSALFSSFNSIQESTLREAEKILAPWQLELFKQSYLDELHKAIDRPLFIPASTTRAAALAAGGSR